MKVLNHLEFLKMPAGTVYRTTNQEFNVGEIATKGDTDHKGYYNYLSLGQPEFWSGEFMGFKHGQQFETDDEGYASGGWHRGDETFIVFELQDLLTLRDRLDLAIEVAKNQEPEK